GRAPFIKCQHDLPAGSLPRLVGLPDVGVLVKRRVVAQAAVAWRNGFYNICDRCAADADDLLRRWRTRREDVQPLVAAQTEIDGNRSTRFGDVDRRWIVHRLKEALEVVMKLGFKGAGVALWPLRPRNATLVCGDRVAVEIRAVVDGINGLAFGSKRVGGSQARGIECQREQVEFCRRDLGEAHPTGAVGGEVCTQGVDLR